MFEVLKKYCPSGYVTKNNLEKLTGGVLKAHTFYLKENVDFQKEKSFKIGKEVAYKIEDIIEWLNSNYEKIETK